MDISFEKRHDNGFFSQCSSSLSEIIEYCNDHQKIPSIDFYNLFEAYKNSNCNLYEKLFSINKELNIDLDRRTNFIRRSNYVINKQQNFNEITPFVEKWYSPSAEVERIKNFFLEKYNIVPEKTIALSFRGTDKREGMHNPNYDLFLSQVGKIQEKENLQSIFVQTDQEQFLDYCKNKFNCISIDELPRTTRKDRNSGLHLSGQTTSAEKEKMAFDFLAATLIISSCKFIINHTGNIGRWITLYRGSAKNTIQVGVQENPNIINECW